MFPDALMLMPVTVPPTTEGRRTAATANRLARNAASLFGVVFDDNPTGHAAITRFDALTLQALAEGAIDVEAGKPDRKISAATLNRFRPNRKAGALLAGAEVLFEPLVPIINDVLRTTGFTEAGVPLVMEVRAAIWAVLMHECYRSQPALFVAAVTARSVQRALAHPWAVYEMQGGVAVGDELPGAGVDAPMTLSILDQTVEFVGTGTVDDVHIDRDHDSNVARSVGEGASAKFLREDLISRWLKHLLDSPDRGFAWMVDRSGVEQVRAFTSPLGSLNAYVDEIAANDLKQVELELKLPRIPSAGELRRLPRTAQRATIWVILQVHRMLRDNVRFNPPTNSRDGDTASVKYRVVQQAEILTELAQAVLPADDPLLVWTRAKWRNKLIAEALERDATEAVTQTRLLREDIERMKLFARDGILDEGSIAEFVRSLSPIINSVADDAKERGAEAISSELRRGLADDWQQFFTALSINPHALLARATSPTQHALPALLAGHLHNYAGFLSRSEDDADVDLGVRLQRDAVVPARKDASEQHGTITALRVARQVLVRALRIQHDRIASLKERRALAQQAATETAEIVASSTDLLNSEAKLRSGQVNTLTAIVTGVVLAGEHGIAIPGVDLARAVELAEHAHRELERRRAGGETFGRLLQLTRLRERLARLDSENLELEVDRAGSL